MYKRLTLDVSTHRLKVKRWRKIVIVNGNDKKGKVAILISDKTIKKTKKGIK